MKFNKGVNKLLTNQIVLHIVFATAFIMMSCFTITGSIDKLVYFIFIALIAHYFSKNMIIVLGVPIVLMSFHSMTMGLTSNGSEGFKNGDKDDKDTKQKVVREKTVKKVSENMALNSEPIGASVSSEMSETKKGKNKSGYNIDYASTVEDAYDELNKIIGGDGIKKLTGDTQNLMKQQLQLAEAMKGMQPLIEGITPIMEQAKSMLGGDGAGGNLAGIADLAKHFTGNK